MYMLRFVNKKCFTVVNSHKSFQKYRSLTNEMCSYKVWNDNVRENVSSLYYSMRFELKVVDMAFALYLRYEIHNMLDQLNLINVYEHFVFCTRTCDINGICTACSRLEYQDSSLSRQCILMFSTMKLLDLCSPSMVKMLRQKCFWSYTSDICNLNDKFICITESRKEGCMFFKTCNNAVQVYMTFVKILLRLYLNMTHKIYKLLTEKYEHDYKLDFYHEECFRYASKPGIYLKIYSEFIPMKDYESRCFKIINHHYLKFISDKKKEKNAH